MTQEIKTGAIKGIGQWNERLAERIYTIKDLASLHLLIFRTWHRSHSCSVCMINCCSKCQCASNEQQWFTSWAKSAVDFKVCPAFLCAFKWQYQSRPDLQPWLWLHSSCQTAPVLCFEIASYYMGAVAEEVPFITALSCCNFHGGQLSKSLSKL